MKIGITSSGKTLDSQVDPRFGRCQYIIIFDTVSKQYETIMNPNGNVSGGAGIQTAQLIIDKDVEVLITGNCGPNAFRTLNAGNVEVYKSATVTLNKAIENFLQKKLSKMNGGNVSDRFGMR